MTTIITFEEAGIGVNEEIMTVTRHGVADEGVVAGRCLLLQYVNVFKKTLQ
jgi:hypothetical protein